MSTDARLPWWECRAFPFAEAIFLWQQSFCRSSLLAAAVFLPQQLSNHLVSTHLVISASTKHRQRSLPVIAIGGRDRQKIRPVSTPSLRGYAVRGCAVAARRTVFDERLICYNQERRYSNSGTYPLANASPRRTKDRRHFRRQISCFLKPQVGFSVPIESLFNWINGRIGIQNLFQF